MSSTHDLTETNIDIVLSSTLSDYENGRYEDGRIIINANKPSEYIASVVMHEVGHDIKANNPEAFETLTDFVLDYLKAKNVDIEQRISQIKRQYKRVFNPDTAREMAIEELVCNTLMSIPSEQEAMNVIAEMDIKEKRSLLKALKDFIQRIKNYLKKYGLTETKAFTDDFEAINKLANMVNESIVRERDTNVEVKNSFRKDFSNVIEEYIKSVNYKLKSFVENVIKNEDKFERFNLNSVSPKQAEDIKNLTGIDVTGYINAISSKNVKHILKRHGKNGNHDHSMKDINDISRMEYILSNYDNVEFLRNSKGEIKKSKKFMSKNNSPSQLVRYSKQIGNKQYYIVEAIPDSRYKKLWVVSAYIQKSTVTQALDVNNTPSTTSETALASPVLYENNIALNDDNVNTKHSLEEIDNKYMSAVESGDMETAQRMVDEYAEEVFANSKIRDKDGKLLKVYHGTPKNFTVFKNSGSGMYFTADPDYAYGYTQLSGTVLKTFLNIKKPFDIINDSVARKLFIDEFIKGGYAQGIHPSSTLTEINKYIQNGIDWVEGDNLIEFLEENEYDYDGLIINEGSDSVSTATGNVQKWRGYSYVTLNPEQIKSADPVTYDDNGNVIPLSERFKDNNKDIRYSLAETEDIVQVNNSRRYYKALSREEWAKFYTSLQKHNQVDAFRINDNGILIPSNINAYNYKLVIFENINDNIYISSVYSLENCDYNIHSTQPDVTNIITKLEEDGYNEKQARTILQHYSSMYGTIFKRYNSKSGRFIKLSRKSISNRADIKNQSNRTGVSADIEQGISDEQIRNIRYSLTEPGEITDADIVDVFEDSEEAFDYDFTGSNLDFSQDTKEAIQNTNKILADMNKLTKGKQISKEALLKLCKEKVKKYSSKQDADILCRDMQIVLNALEQCKEQEDFNVVFFEMIGLCKNVLDKSMIKVDHLKEERENIKAFLKDYGVLPWEMFHLRSSLKMCHWHIFYINISLRISSQSQIEILMLT